MGLYQLLCAYVLVIDRLATLTSDLIRHINAGNNNLPCGFRVALESFRNNLQVYSSKSNCKMPD